jgi:hypothetical protein
MQVDPRQLARATFAPQTFDIGTRSVPTVSTMTCASLAAAEMTIDQQPLLRRHWSDVRRNRNSCFHESASARA